MDDDDRRRPLLLNPDNFTPPARTPWGGRKIVHVLKRGIPLGAAQRAYDVVGESWELSLDPSFPSMVEESGRALADVVADDPYAFLGREALRGRRGTALLVKLIDAAEPLSVQIHPADDHPGLSADESGKPECWYVVEAEPGAGLFLGLSEEATPSRVAAALESGQDVSALLGFVPVTPGDFFVIEAGTPHAIGAGTLLVEPQLVLPGRRGVTYRYWDWNRRYDARGRPDPRGEPRALHVAEALAVTRWDAPRGAALLGRIRVRSGAAQAEAPVTLQWLSRTRAVDVRADQSESADAEPGAALPFGIAVARLCGEGEVALAAQEAMVCLTVLAGEVRVRERHGRTTAVPAGRTAALPACIGDVVLDARKAHAILAAAG
jgi:mannose-6-phosphate isomerase